MKHFQLDGIPYYVTAPNKQIAALVCIKNHWGVTPENLVEIEKIPQNAEHVISF